LDGQPREDLDDEHGDDQAVDGREERTIFRHHAGARLEAEGDGVDEDKPRR
jgi:hypothetical protein